MQGQGYPESNWTGFHKRLEQAETALKAWTLTRLQIWEARSIVSGPCQIAHPCKAGNMSWSDARTLNL